MIQIVKSKYVCNWNATLFEMCISIKGADLGIRIHNWGVRFMLISHHVCIYLR